MMRRLPPELTALAGAIIVWLVFAIAGGSAFRSVGASRAILDAAAPLAILAVAVAMLMIGGEFDLSIGSIIGACSMFVMVMVQHYEVPLMIALIVSLAFALAAGFTNGYIVTRTGLPSFIVTLASLFLLRGLAIAVTRLVTRRTQLGGLNEVAGYDVANSLFGSAITWAVIIAAMGAWILHRTHWGNWIFGTGGSADAARRAGVPVASVKIALFMTTAFAAWLVAVLQLMRYTGADALRGEQQEFRAIIAAVIGGTLLTGGYGSVIGAVVGAIIFGMVQQGIVITGIDADWFQVFLGIMLIIAVLANTYARKRIVEAR